MTRLPVRADGEVELPVHDIDVAPLCVVRNVVHGGSVHSSLHTQKYFIIDVSTRVIIKPHLHVVQSVVAITAEVESQ